MNWKHKVDFEYGRYARYSPEKKRWYLFDSAGNPRGSRKTIKEIEELNGEIK